MPWHSPFPLQLVACASKDDWKRIAPGETMMPVAPHPGAFGDTRARHVHEGIDIYAPPLTPVLAVEDGMIVGVTPLSGSETRGGYWHDMEAVLVQGKSGVAVYCEITPLKSLEMAMPVKAGQQLGNIYPKGYKYKNENRTEEDRDHELFLHLELHHPHTRMPVKWLVNEAKPSTLFDPTPHLLQIAKKL